MVEQVTDWNMEYNYDYVDEMCNKTGVIKFGASLTSVFFWVVITLSLVGNTLVLAILTKYENLKSLTNIFILNLALSDLIFTAGLPFWALHHVYGWTFGEVACKAVSFVFYTGFYSSIMFLTMMTIHRYVAVVHPLSDLGSKKLCYGTITSAVIWSVSLSAAVPALVFCKVQSDTDNPKFMHCDYGDRSWRLGATYQQNILFIISLCVITFCYVKILVTILHSRSHTRHRTVKLIFTIAVVFFVGWAPYNVAVFLKSLTDVGGMYPFTECHVSTAVDYAFYVCRLIAFSHCCLNPVFYVFVGVKFRNHLKKMLKKLMSCQTIVDTHPRNSRLHSNGEEMSMY